MHLFFIRYSQNTKVGVWTPLKLIYDLVAEFVLPNYFACSDAPDYNV